ncbi:hypothetical protein CVT26_011149 [Gymnopilus dilepis]|uniref:Uncharacterized protein n=1 Tax=Gymnopilus dilepis TaxID=231916 RepID=A0A409VJ88_9AGAR|nr:hypothetical protein CVT26_011149 [Gymnopilus dilepis]
MYQRDPRAFPYDDQGSAYPTGHMSHNSDDYSATGYQQQGSSDQYYTPPQHPLGGDIHDTANPSGPYYRSMTPSLVPTNRYPSSSRDPRYYGSPPGFGGSSSSSPSAYPAQNSQYPSQYLPPADPRSGPVSHTPQFIPTPSEIAHSYANYNHSIPSPHSPTSPEGGFPPDYPLPPHMVPSTAGSGHRTSRLANVFLAKSVAKPSRGLTTERGIMKLSTWPLPSIMSARTAQKNLVGAKQTFDLSRFFSYSSFSRLTATIPSRDIWTMGAMR